MAVAPLLYPVILSGGAGTRLWPVSRALNPKPFIPLPDGESLLQKVYMRAASLPNVAEIMTITNRDLYFRTQDEYATLPVASDFNNAFILEPVGRNTAPAVALAALHAAHEKGADTVVLVLPADHLIEKLPAFQQAVAEAAALAVDGKIVTFGVHPTSPETGYGYIESDGNTVKRFVEKPVLEVALEYVSSGRYLWNSGMFCFCAGTMIAEMEKHAPDVINAARACYETARQSSGAGFSQLEMVEEGFETLPEISLDYAVMEKTDKAAVVACDIGWSDIGSWCAFGATAPADADGNRVVGQAILHGASNCFVQSPDRIAGIVGVEDLIIIDTPDAFLVANNNSAQDVKHIVSHLRAQKNEAYKIHRTAHRPWGTYTVLEEGPCFKIKRIEVKPGASLSLQMHHHRSEHWVVVEGTAKVVNGDKELVLECNQSTYIPAGNLHRLANPGHEKLILIEVQTGSYLGEDDIVRFEDVYGRA